MKELQAKLAEWGLGEATIQMGIDYTLKILGALLVIYLGFLIGGRVQGFIANRLAKRDFDASVSKFISSVARWGIILLAFIGCFSIFGVDTTSFAAVIGGATVAIGLALQGSLSHVASGIMLLIFRPFSVGDVIKVAGEVGGVNEIGLFAVTLDTPDRRRIIIPNGIVFGGTVENITHHSVRRVDVAVGADYSADLDETRKVLLAACKSVKNVILDDEDFAPAPYLVDLGDSSVNWSVRVFANTEDFWAVREDLTRAVKMKLDEAGIGIPFPQIVVHNEDAA